MMTSAREGDITVGARCLLSLVGIDASEASPEQTVGARLLAFGLFDLQVIAERGGEEG